jgi:phage recombination protein Bet
MSTPQQTTQALLIPSTSPLILELANTWGMQPGSMLSTLKATVFPQKDRNDNKIEVSNEQMLMFLQVCREYKLNPFIKEIYAFVGKGGGIVPMVPIDGWTHIINANPELDGLKFVHEWEADANSGRKKIISITCIIYRKDRTHPTEVTEYFSECNQPTKDPWKQWPVRMLRHKALIQCARIAFSLAGIYDPDEAERIAAGDESLKPVVTRPTVIEGRSAESTQAQLAASTAPKAQAQTQTQTQETPATAAALGRCVCNCCKNGACDCEGKDEFERCGCDACVKYQKLLQEHPEQEKTPTQETKEEPAPELASPPMEEVFKGKKKAENPTSAAVASSTVATNDAAPGEPAGPYVPNDKLGRLWIACAAADPKIKIVKGSHDDELHKMLEKEYGIKSVNRIPANLFLTICKRIAPKMQMV